MKLHSDFYKLPLTFDADLIASEIKNIPDSLWREHPSGFKGNSALILVSADGGENDSLIGPMLPTPILKQCGYIQQILAAFRSPIGRTRLMRLEGGSEVTEHSDINYHWYNHVRIHVPVVTHPDIMLTCNGNSAHMKAGEAWIFDTWKMHSVNNPTDCTRIHLVIDTCGSSAFWDLVKKSERPFDEAGKATTNISHVSCQPGITPTIYYEKFNAPLIMAPGEVDALVDNINTDMNSASSGDALSADRFQTITEQFKQEWRAIWCLHGSLNSGWPIYRQLKAQTRSLLASIQAPLSLASNGANAIEVFSDRVLNACMNPQLASLHSTGTIAGEYRKHITGFKRE